MPPTPTRNTRTSTKSKSRAAEFAAASAVGRKAAGPKAIPPTLRTATPARIAAERRRLELKQQREIKRRVREYEASVSAMETAEASAAAPPRVRGAFKTLAAVAPPRLLAEGDSWFDYLKTGVIVQLQELIHLPILNLAQAGDEARGMLGVKDRRKLRDHLFRAAQAGKPFDALLFSGGGNDIVGNPLCLWIKSYDPATMPTAADVIDEQRFEHALGIVCAAYEDLIALRDELSPSTALFFHGYDFVIPSNQGVCGLGPWLKPSLDFRHVPESLQPAVAKEMLTRFQKKLEALASPTKQIFVVPTQGTLKGTSTWWVNEMHPSQKGFIEIAKKFRDSLRAVLSTI
jgi:hypothetical protein